MKCTSFVVMMAAVLAMLLTAGCTSAPVKETSTTNVSVKETSTPNASTEPQVAEKWVEIYLQDGTSVIGKYVSETAAFTTIVVMYTSDMSAYKTNEKTGQFGKDIDKYMVKGSGNTVGIKNTLINSMVVIENPTETIAARLQAQSDEAAAQQKAAEDKAEGYRIAKEAREAKKAP